MKWKGFLKPDWKKIILTIFLITLSSFYVTKDLSGTIIDMPGYYYYGWPLYYYLETDNVMMGKRTSTFLFHNLIVNIILFYLLSCLVVWIYDKVKKKELERIPLPFFKKIKI